MIKEYQVEGRRTSLVVGQMWTATSRDALEHYQNYHTREQEQAICEFLGICQQCPALGSRIQKRNTSGHEDKGN